MKKWYSPGSMALAIVLVLFIISASVVVTLNFRPLYYHDIGALQIVENTGISEEIIRKNYDILIDYNSMFYDGELSFPDFGMSETGRIHFEEVKDIFVGFQKIALVTLIIGAAGIILKARKKDYSYLYPTAILSVGLPAVLGAFIATNWDRAFVLFHEIMFDNDYWIFDYDTDPIINILPDEFFMHCAIMIIGGIVLGAAVCLISGTILNRRKSHKNKNR
ncbi:MAG: TIGR01906 family membrane protein [Firmicutes bacterium]|nr:TIGR01906 family membrane protein [Bacillota bacterium]